MSIFGDLTDAREQREPLPPQKAIVAFGSVTTSVSIFWCTPELKLDIEQAMLDDSDVFEHGAENPDHGIWVWEGTIKGTTYPSTPDRAEEYDVEYPGTWRAPNLEEWEYIKGMAGAYASQGDIRSVSLAGSKHGDEGVAYGYTGYQGLNPTFEDPTP